MPVYDALRRWCNQLLASLLVCGWLLALVACTSPAATSTLPPAPYFSATDVSMDSPTDGWSVGTWVTPGRTSDATTATPAMAHFQDGQWRLAPISVAANLGPYESYHLVRMLSPTDGWATTQGAIYHYDGVHWRVAHPASDSIRIADLQMYSRAIGWAVGSDGVLQYTHGDWVNVTTSLPPPPSDWQANWAYPGLRSVAIASPTDVWAMGDGGVIWHYDGTAWRSIVSPYFPNRFYTSASVDGYPASGANLANFAAAGHNFEALYASQLLSSTLGWSVGGATLAPSSMDWGPAVVEEYQNGSWQIIHIMTRDHATGAPYKEPVLYTLAAISAQESWIGGAWARPTLVGSGDAPPVEGNPTYAPLLLHYHAGQWTFVSAPAVGAIHRLVMFGPNEGWAAADGGLLHYASGQWRLVKVSPAG